MPRKVNPKHTKILQALARGEERVIAELFSAIQNRTDALAKLMPEIFRRVMALPEQSFTVGVTGPPGAGKSSLMRGVLDQLQEIPLGVLLVDPASPFSGGALLGDRLRIDTTISPHHFVRSLSSRGRAGGLCPAVRDLIRIFTLAGKKMVWLETVGVGQNEIDVMNVADLTCVVLTPDSGDVVQTMKAGLLEIADCFVVNKADHPHADEMVAHLKSMGGANPLPVFSTVATTGAGVLDWVNFVKTRLQQKRKERNPGNDKKAFSSEVRERFSEDFQAFLEKEFRKKAWQSTLADMVKGNIDPYTFVQTFKTKVLKTFLRKS